MVDRAKLFGGGLRVLLSGGSWAHLMQWCKQDEGRMIETSLTYKNSKADWSLALKEPDGSYLYTGSGGSLEDLTFKAVGAVGKNS